MCQLSKRYGINRPADMVHHVFPRDEFPEYTWADWNLISLTNAMHVQDALREILLDQATLIR